MKVKSSLVVALVVVVAIFLILQLASKRAEEDKPLFPQFRPEKAARIAIDGKDRRTVLEKQGEVWIVTSEDSFPAEASAVERIFDEIGKFSRKDVVSTNPSKHAVYNVDTTGTAVTIEDRDGDTLAAFVVGKVGPDYQSTYVRNVLTDEVILSPSYLPPVFERGGRTWQNLAIFDYEPFDIQKIHIDRPSEKVTLVRDSGGSWYISEPESLACDTDRVSRLVRTLAYLKGEEIAGRAPVEGSGLAEPDSSVWFELSNGKQEKLIFGDITDRKRIYTKAEPGNIVYLVASYKVNAIMPKLKHLRAKETEEQEKGS